MTGTSESSLCLGLDPVAARLPDELSGPASERVDSYLRAVLHAIAETGLPPRAIKFNIGFYAVLDRPLENSYGGSRALASALALSRKLFPEAEIILDSKRGDIARSGANYAAEAFDVWGADAMTASAYMGDDSVEVFLQRAKEAQGTVYLLATTSNPGARRFQQLPLKSGRAVCDGILEAIVEWNREWGVAGAVVGATQPEALRSALKRLAEVGAPVLIPGVGSQGGSAEDVVGVMERVGYPPSGARVNVSSGITHPWKEKPAPKDWLSVVIESYKRFWESLALSGLPR